MKPFKRVAIIAWAAGALGMLASLLVPRDIFREVFVCSFCFMIGVGVVVLAYMMWDLVD